MNRPKIINTRTHIIYYMTDKELMCNRCGHEWDRVLVKIRRRSKIPKYCPTCHSPYWNKERVRPLKEEMVTFEV
jgi:NAD-dependent SIR2 family protein deacetylase